MQVLLRVNTAKKPEKKIKVSRDVLIGRERGRCDLRVASSEVSRRHCQILVGEKTVDVRDLGSANGTRVNGELIPAKINFPVNPGDTLTVGPLEIRVEFQGKKNRSLPTRESEDGFLSQDCALAALDAPGNDMDQSAPEILIENRLVDSADDYGSNLETVDASELNKGNFAADGKSFDSDSSGDDSAPEQLSPLDEEDPVELERIETSEPLAEEPAPPVLSIHTLVLELAPDHPDPAELIPLEANSAEQEPDKEVAVLDAGDKKTGRLKSLFGRIGRKKEADEPPSESDGGVETPPADPVATPEPVAIPDPASADLAALAMPPELEAPSVDLQVPDGGEVWEPPEGEWEADDDDELVSVEDVGSVDEALVEDFEEEELVELEDEADDAQPADEGFADFLNHLDEPK
jgi:predicted component of type VI protein secretion system